MKKYFVIFVLFAAFLPVFLSGCASMREESEKKYMLRMFVVGAACGLATWNPGGFILGAFVADAVSVAKIHYEDIKLENREEAVRRLNQLKQAKGKGPIEEEDRTTAKRGEEGRGAEPGREEDRTTTKRGEKGRGAEPGREKNRTTAKRGERGRTFEEWGRKKDGGSKIFR